MAGWFVMDRQAQISRNEGRNLGRRIESIVQIFSEIEPAQYPAFLRAVNTPTVRVRVIPLSRVLPLRIDPQDDRRLRRLYRFLEQQLGEQSELRIRLVRDWPDRKPSELNGPFLENRQFLHNTPEGMRRRIEHERRVDTGEGQDVVLRRNLRPPEPILIVQVGLGSDTWIEVANRSSEVFAGDWPVRMLAIFLVSLVCIFGMVVWVVHQFVKPLKKITAAAEALGKNVQIGPLPEDGSSEIRVLSRAFNTMQTRLQRYMAERNEMLAAISHDLKTPLTRLRLRIALLNESESHAKFEHDLDEMETMINETLDFMRGDRVSEKTVQFDMNALLESIQQDMLVAGRTIEIKGRANHCYEGKVVAIRRLLCNVLDNACRYAEQVSVVIVDTPEALVLRVIDNGPGIPGAEKEKVFQPFYQLDRARQKKGGGSGLGLGIARNIAYSHGGTLALQDNTPTGLVVEIMLPR
jgi:signal transduction histidine kinase